MKQVQRNAVDTITGIIHEAMNWSKTTQLTSVYTDCFIRSGKVNMRTHSISLTALTSLRKLEIVFQPTIVVDRNPYWWWTIGFPAIFPVLKLVKYKLCILLNLLCFTVYGERSILAICITRAKFSFAITFRIWKPHPFPNPVKLNSLPKLLLPFNTYITPFMLKRKYIMTWNDQWKRNQ